MKLIEGCRHKVLVKLFQKNDLIHEENGELLFKKDGLSGIVIMNIAAYINRLKTKENITIHIDFVPDIKEVKNPSSSYLSKKLACYADMVEFVSTRLFRKDRLPTYFDNRPACIGRSMIPVSWMVPDSDVLAWESNTSPWFYCSGSLSVEVVELLVVFSRSSISFKLAERFLIASLK